MIVKSVYAQPNWTAHLEQLKLLFKSKYTHFKQENRAVLSLCLRFANSSKLPVKPGAVKIFLAKTMICEVAQVLFIC